MNKISVRTFVTVLILVFLVTAILASAMTFMLASVIPALPGNKTSQNAPLSKELQEIQGVIDKNYYKPADAKALEEGAMKGMVAGLNDPYSVYMTAEEAKEFFQMSQGQYSGIGVTVSQDADTKTIKIDNVAEGGPAQKAGILVGDIIVSVDGQDVTGQSMEAVTSKIKGETGTSVRVTVQRGEEKLDFDIVRTIVKLVNINSRMLPDNIGYIRIREFASDSDKEFKTALDGLKSQNMKGLILDLRDNPGGMVDVTSKIADTLLPQGTIFYTLDRNQTRNDVTSDANSLNLPIVVLVNEYSASASEILSGALQDYGTPLVGIKTYGKGVIQSFYTLSNGDTIKLTIMEYFTPKGREIQKIGLTPDFVVDLSDSVKQNPSLLSDDKNDTQLQKAIEVMRGKLGL